MRRVLVPLDDTPMATQILPDAERLAGPDGELILLRDATVLPHLGMDYFRRQRAAVESARADLAVIARQVQADQVVAQPRVVVLGDAVRAIDEGAKLFEADMIACATHGRGLADRLRRGSVAWKALAHSPVPILLRHVEESGEPPLGESIPLAERRIMVPLDGSVLAEQALPLAQALLEEWHASVWLVHVLPAVSAVPGAFYGGLEIEAYDLGQDSQQDMRDYLQRVGRNLRGETHISMLAGRTVDVLTQAIANWSITDIVMASHGRSGLSRVILGSVADDLLQRLHLPIIIIPALASVGTPIERTLGEPATPKS